MESVGGALSKLCKSPFLSLCLPDPWLCSGICPPQLSAVGRQPKPQPLAPRSRMIVEVSYLNLVVPVAGEGDKIPAE